jgi:hypothetical protein
MTAPVALLTRNASGALEAVEPVLACATGLPCEVCEAANDCGMIDETWLEARGQAGFSGRADRRDGEGKMNQHEELAFPQSLGQEGTHTWSSDQKPGCGGMTLRDYFAGQAIEAARHEVAAEATMYLQDDWTSDDIAAKAYEIADAMLDERGK